MVHSLLNLDTKPLLAVLFWGNLVSIILVLSYRFSHSSHRDNTIAACFSLAKFCQTCAYFCLFFRGTLPDLISVNLGNSLLFMGFYQEATAMLLVIQEKSKGPYIFLGTVLACTLLLFNGVEFLHPDSSIRVVTASLSVILILALPNFKILTKQHISGFKRTVGILYLLFISLLLPRTIYALFVEMTILTNSFIQSLTLIVLIILMVFGLSAYLLLMKEDSDRIISALATTDALTGLSNRRSFLDAAHRLFARCKRDGGTPAVLFLDIDFFKRINDTYGHMFGDAVLVALAEVIRQGLRAGDLACRYGGEEFVILVLDADAAQASKVASRIMAGIAGTLFPQQPDFSFTVSIGIMCGTPMQNQSVTDYIKNADIALYKAKTTGRNRIVEYDSGTEAPLIHDAQGAA
jgi:diguanylate cyclase (GGDEF)-like protein